MAHGAGRQGAGMSILILFLVGFAVMFFGAIPPPTRWWRRERTDREEAMHNQIQQAMNWTPGQFSQRADGRWFNAKGEEGVKVTFSELCKMHHIEDKD